MFKTTEKLRILNEKLQIHFQQHFAARELPEPPELEKPDQYPHLKDDTLPIDESMPTEKEVKAVLKTFKNKHSQTGPRLCQIFAVFSQISIQKIPNFRKFHQTVWV